MLYQKQLEGICFSNENLTENKKVPKQRFEQNLLTHLENRGGNEKR